MLVEYFGQRSCQCDVTDVTIKARLHRKQRLTGLWKNLWEKEQTQTRQLLRGNAWSGSTSNVYKTIVAEDILNAEMLNTVKQYQSYLGEKGKDLNRAVDLRQNTSIIIDT
ncbi:hypothetical protein DPMN_111230 [Dreissena polymorpha]|uniref:Uncharacterized protein n=1 Tax=Dreissena polymorpha TaxID=45954 RepID=A0A9D4KE75_DREPO|nr:hypothetical protein DPMN_111230 [Dreissena polymorpha]